MMSTDISGLSEQQQKYFLSLLNEIFARRFGAGSGWVTSYVWTMCRRYNYAVVIYELCNCMNYVWNMLLVAWLYQSWSMGSLWACELMRLADLLFIVYNYRGILVYFSWTGQKRDRGLNCPVWCHEFSWSDWCMDASWSSAPFIFPWH